MTTRSGKLKARRGRRPTPEEIKRMGDRGYILPAEAVRLFKASASTLYVWARTKGRLKAPEGDDRPPIIKSRKSNVWLLRDAVAAMFALPGDPP